MTRTDVSPRVLPRLVALDLDDMLAPSKSTMLPTMVTALRRLLDVVPVCIISGGQVGQFRDQILVYLGADADELSRFHFMPTCGARYYTYDPPRAQGDEDAWTLVYANNLTPEQIRTGFEVVEAQVRRLDLWEEQTWGAILEDRDNQITFFALGQEASLDVKHAWDPTGEKKVVLCNAVAPPLPDLEVRSGGSTSVDIILKGADKAYDTKCLAEMTGVASGEMIFAGDRPDPEGNDYPVKALGIPCQAASDWQDTVAYVTSLVSPIASDVHGSEDPAAQISLGARP